MTQKYQLFTKEQLEKMNKVRMQFTWTNIQEMPNPTDIEHKPWLDPSIPVYPAIRDRRKRNEAMKLLFALIIIGIGFLLLFLAATRLFAYTQGASIDCRLQQGIDYKAFSAMKHKESYFYQKCVEGL